MAVPKVASRPPAAAEVKRLLESPEIQRLVADLRETRWTGRPGYPVQAMVGLCLVKAMYALPTWTRVVALVKDHWALQRALGCDGDPPSVWSAYRFASKLRENAPMVERCIHSVVAGLKRSCRATAATSPSTQATCPPTRTGSASSARTARSNATGTRTPMHRGDIGRRSRLGAAAASSGIAFTRRSARRPTCRLRGRSRPRRRTKPASRPG